MVAHHRHHLANLPLVELGKLTVVDGDVGQPAGAVLRQPGTGHLAQYRLGAGLQTAQVVGALRGIGNKVDAQGTIAAAQHHRAVFGDDGGNGPGQCKGLTPARRPAGDGDHRQAGASQALQRGQGGRLDGAVTRQGVVDVGHHTAQARQPGRRQLGQRPQPAGRGGGAQIGQRGRGPICRHGSGPICRHSGWQIYRQGR